MKKEMRIGVIGLGLMGNIHLSSYQKMKNVVINGVADKAEEKVKEYSKNYDCPGFGNAEDLIAKDEIDIIDICVPTSLHKKFALKSLEEGKNIICEKPIARNLSEAREISKRVKKSEVKMFVGHVVRFFPEYAKIRDRVNSGDIGEVSVVRTFRGGVHPSVRSEWYSDPDKSGGIILDSIIHDFDWLRWTIGEIESVYTKGTALNERPKEIALVNVRFQNGALGHVEGSWAHPQDFPFTTKVEVAGTQGLIQHDSSNSSPLNIYSEDDEGVETPESLWVKSPWYRELEHFIDCLETGREPIVTIKDSIEALRISLAARKSLESGQRVEVDKFE